MQKHETVVELVLPTHTGLASANGSPFESADGLVTTHQEISLAVFSADCLPLLMVDPTTNTIAVVHAGWRGLAQGILTHALALLRQVGVKPNDLLVWIGPHIQWSCYKIRPDSPTREEKIQAFGAHEGDIKRHNDELFLDLTHSAMRQLKELGVDPNRVDIGECTACHPEKYFSYYADKGKVSGIMMGVIGWKR